MSLKRKGNEDSGALVVSKKQRTDGSGAIVAVEQRTSRLQAPTMLLEGHQVSLTSAEPDASSQKSMPSSSALTDSVWLPLALRNRFVCTVRHPFC